MSADKKSLEEGALFTPRFSGDGLIACITIDDASGDVLMLAHMNREALDKTLASGIMHYWSRSRSALISTIRHLPSLRRMTKSGV